MQNQEVAVAILGGAITLLVFLGILLARRLTADDSPVEQKAKRSALLLSVLAASLILYFEVRGFIDGDPVIAGYLLIPSLFAVGVILIAGRSRLYRALGGRSSLTVKLPAADSNEIRDQHEAMWNRLRQLPHFRESLQGELISLLTGDRVFWSTYHRDPCLAIALSAKTTITVYRYETLARYVQIQTQLARALDSMGGAAPVQGEAQ